MSCSQLNAQVSVGRRDVVAEEARPINSISRVQFAVTAASKTSAQLKQVSVTRLAQLFPALTLINLCS